MAYYTNRGAFLESNLATPRRAEVVNMTVTVQQTGATNEFNALDAGGQQSGTSTLLTGGFHTTAAAVTATEAASSVGDTDANRIFRDSDDNTIRLKKTGGDAVNAVTDMSGSIRFSNVDVSAYQFRISTAAADANFTGSPSSLTVLVRNSTGSTVDPFSLVAAGERYDILIQGVVIT